MSQADVFHDEFGEHSESKVKPIAELAQLIAKHKRRGLKVVHCHGVFDVIHPGHIRHLKSAKAEGDLLVVTITGDKFVDKGPGRPAFNEQLRSEALAALSLCRLCRDQPRPQRHRFDSRTKTGRLRKGRRLHPTRG